MSIDPKLAARLAADHWNNQPSPHAEGLTNGEFPIAVKLATKFKFGGHASPQEASAFWGEFKATNQRLTEKGKEAISPEEAGHLLDAIAPVSFTYHGRPPSMHELTQMRDQTPKQVRDYFTSLPDQNYPSVTAGDMVKQIVAAKPWANQHLGRDPVKLEAQYLHHSGENPSDYYARLAPKSSQTGQQEVQQGGVQAQAGGDGSGRSPGNVGGQAPDQRGVPGGRPGVPQG